VVDGQCCLLVFAFLFPSSYCSFLYISIICPPLLFMAGMPFWALYVPQVHHTFQLHGCSVALLFGRPSPRPAPPFMFLCSAYHIMHLLHTWHILLLIFLISLWYFIRLYIWGSIHVITSSGFIICNLYFIIWLFS
jgi:hypothetical protein